MSCDRQEVIKHFLSVGVEEGEVKSEAIDNFSFSDSSEDLLLESLKMLIYSYCNEEADVTILRKINSKITD